MSRALLLVGSPRGRKSASTLLGSHLLTLLEDKGMETEIVWLIRQFSSKERMDRVFEAVEGADIVVLAAPLYDDCQPFIVVKVMEEFLAREMNMDQKRFFPIINSGFGDPIHITAVALSIYKSFASKVGFEWAGSLAVGGGEMLRAREGKTFDDLGFLGKKLRRRFADVADALGKGRIYPDNVFEFPRVFKNRLFMRMGNSMWKSMAKKNGADVDAKPYAP